MARIPQQEVERLKQEISLQRLAEARGIELKRHGKDLMGLCPFHDDREPSLVISPEKNLWHCLGACQTGGSVIDWVMKSEGVSFRLAVEMLRADIPSLAASDTATTHRQPATKLGPRLEAIAQSEEPDAVVLGRVVDYYHATLKQSPEALAYLEHRGLMHAEMVDYFKLGFANRTLGYRLPLKALKAGALIRGQLQRLGIYRESGHEHFRGSVVIPIIGEQGEVLEIYGRKITPNLRSGTPLHLYLPGPHRGIFNLQALKVSQEIIVCEALIDALTFWCAGFRNVTSAYGVEGFTGELREAMREHGVKKVLIAYDRDVAGDKAAEKLASQLADFGMEVFRVLFPKGMDANQYALKVKPANKSLEVLLRNAQWLAGSRDVQVPAEIEQDVETEPDFPLVAESAEPVAESQPAAEQLSAEVREQEVTLQLGDRRWRIRGLGKNLSYDSLKVNVLVARGESFFVDVLELYSARQRAAFLKQAGEELDIEEHILKSDLGKVVLKLEELQHDLIDKALQSEKKQRVEIGEQDKREAFALLRDPKLLDRILSDFERCGVVGEETNKLVGYLSGVSRKLDEPLAVVIQSSSAAGKSSLMEAVLSFMPEEEKVQYSAMTGQSLFYLGERDLQHKILAIAEEQGAQNAGYALKLLQSEGELTIASTGKDPSSGRLITHEYRVQGPVMIFMTTTAIEVDEELLNRCIVLTVDEGREQTRAIHERQRQAQTIEGLLAKQQKSLLLKLHQNAQRLLRPLFVANPYAKELRFFDHATRTRRDHMKYLTLIRSIALLHQYQRPIREIEQGGAKLRYIEATRQDIEIAERLCRQVLSRSLDELGPQTRRLLEQVEKLVEKRAKTQGIERSDVRFTQRELRGYTGFSATQVKVQLSRLQALEYVAIHYQGHRQRYLYELLTSTTDGGAFPSNETAQQYDPNRSGFCQDRSATGPASERRVLLNEGAQIAQPVRKSQSIYKGKDSKSYRSNISSLAASTDLPSTDWRPVTV
jgi:DNA primase